MVITVGVVMTVIVVVLVLVLVLAVAVRVVAIAVVLLRHDLVALKQAHAQQQGKGDLPLHRPEDARIGLDLPQLRFQGAEPLFGHQVALVEQQHVAVHDLGPGYLALQQVIAEVLRIHQGDDRVEAGRVAQVAAQEGHGHWQRVR